MSLEKLLRDTMHSRAGDAPSCVGLLDTVRVRFERRRRRRTAIVTATGVAVATAAVSLSAGFLVATAAPDTPAGPPVASGLELVAPEYELPRFPFTPGWEPAGIGEPFVSISGTSMTLSYPRLSTGEPPLAVIVEQEEPAWLASKLATTTADRMTVRSRTATLRRADHRPDRPVLLTWQEKPGQWVAVVGAYPVDLTAVVRYVEALTTRPLPAAPPFRFDLVPRGFAVHELSQSSMLFAPLSADTTRQQATVLIELRAAERHGTAPTYAGGREIEIVESAGLFRAYVYLDGRTMLAVSSGGKVTMSREQLILFAAGIDLTPQARAQP